jgi:ketosteroid isomerase-like protein
MSEENVEVVSRAIDAVNALMRGELTSEGLDAWLGFYHPDVELHDLPTIPDAPVRRGYDDLRKWIEMMRDTWSESSNYEPEEFTAAGDFVIVAVRAHGWGRGSGVPVEISFFTVFEMRDGKVQRMWSYFDREEALEAAGLSE